ncbi:hypothetical protein M413DRAFT_59190 [Hebeloma cylindrosporum]|uniref:G domain-containing protein n=1 Tax=Hebeloma cylindrosporum TaxID=76867 RepID=A0A0C3D043_HEBCY|nr:hypothetical protein M413DRAFT_59190 [Hebeloma cylindrosporum h7]
MGPTGSGKSTFIFTATGVDTGIGHSLESCTKDVKMVKFSFPEVSNCDVVFVDMPGFDATGSSGKEVLKIIENWLYQASKKNIVVSGLLYFHRISDNRMAGTPLQSLHSFNDLRKKHGFQHVIITTTMWDEVDEDLGTNRESELKSKYWQPILERFTTGRFLHTRQSAFMVLEGFIDTANRDFSRLIQDELSALRQQIGDNTVGMDLFSKVESRVNEQDEVLKRLRIEMKTTMLLGGGTLESVLAQYRTIRAELALAMEDLQKTVDVRLGKRLSSLVG